jgi:SAM-dependent methyltransferase
MMSGPDKIDGIDNKTNYRSAELVRDYDRVRRIGEARDYVNDIELGYFIGWVERLAGPTATVIDFGAGTGKLALALAARGHKVTAFDQSPAMLGKLREKAAAAGLTVDTQEGDIMRDAPKGRFDVAVSSRVLMHVADPRRMLASMAAAADRGVVADVPRARSPNALQTLLRRLRGAEAYRCFDDAAFLRLLADVGLKPLDASALFNLPIGLHLALGREGLSRRLERLAAPLSPFASTLFVAAEKAPS